MDRGCYGGTGRQTQGRAAVHGTVFGIVVGVQSASPGCKRLERSSLRIWPRLGRAAASCGSGSKKLEPAPDFLFGSDGTALAAQDRDLKICLLWKQGDDFGVLD